MTETREPLVSVQKRAWDALNAEVAGLRAELAEARTRMAAIESANAGRPSD